MKYLVARLAALALFPVSTFAVADTATSCVVEPAGVIAWYPGENSAEDFRGNHHGTLVNGATFAPGLIGSAFSFDGVNDYIVIPNSPALNPTNGMTIEGWLFLTDDSSGYIVSKWGDSGTFGSARSYLVGKQPNRSLSFAISDGANQDNTSFHVFNTPNNVLTLNAWNHFAAVYDKTTGQRRIYVNGALVATRTDAPVNITVGAADVAIGAWLRAPSSASNNFKGKVDEVTIYDRPLSPAQIQSIAAAGAEGKCRGVPPPPHGGLSQTRFTINGSSSPTPNLADTVVQFAADQSGRPAGLFCRVQWSVTPTVESSWTDLSDGNSGRMAYNSSIDRFVLNTTNYPAQNDVSFRVIGAAQGYPDAISNPVGPFNLSSAVAHLASPKLTLLRNSTVADMYFHARQSALYSGIALRVQASTTPGNEGSWTDLANGNAGHMTQSTDPNIFLLLVNQYPPATGIYFRAIAAAPGAIDGISPILGPYTLTADTPPSVSITLPPGSGNGSPDNPRVVTTGLLNFSATATSPNNNVSSLRLLLDGKTLTPPSPNGSSSVAIQYSTSAIGLGDHVIDAVAIDDLGCRARGGTNPLYIRIVPAPGSVNEAGADAVAVGGKVYTLVNSGGAWNDATTWRDANGNTGVPGDQDFAIVFGKTVHMPVDVVVKSVTMNGGKIVGPGTLSILGILTISSGTFENAFLSIFQDALCELTNVSDVQFAGTIVNYGTINIRGSGGLKGVTTLAGPGKVNFLTPLSIAPGALLNPAAGIRGLTANNLHVSEGLLRGAAEVITHDGGSVITHDGGSLISNDGGSLISQDGGGLISQDGGGLISQDGGGLIASGAGNLVASGAGNRPSRQADSKSARDHDEPTGFVLDGGEIDLTDVTLAGSLTMNGGVLSGTGKILGDVTNNGGRVSPGHSAGGITVEGSYTQGASGTLALENGGRAPTEFDQLTATGAVMLGGNLEVQNINGYTPDPADTLNPLGFSSVSGSFAAVSGNAQVSVGQTGALLAVAPDALAMTGVVSRKVHGGGATFDVVLPSTGLPGVECRSGGANGDHTIVFTFTNNLASGQAAVTAGPGSVVGLPAVNGTTLSVNLTGVTNAQTVTVTLNNVTDAASQVLPATSISVGFLLGDVNGDRNVNSGDATITRNRSGQPTDGTNFRADVNTDGTVNSGDFTIVRGRSGTAL